MLFPINPQNTVPHSFDLQYPRYLDADRLCSGVVQAYTFRAALAEVGSLEGTATGGSIAQCLFHSSLIFSRQVHSGPFPRAPLPSQAAGEPAAKRGWPEGAPAQALAGLSAVYAALIQPKFQLKVDFLRGLLKRLRSGSCLATAGAAEADLRLLAFCAAIVAGLPYRRGDEPCLAVQVGLQYPDSGQYMWALCSRRHYTCHCLPCPSVPVPTACRAEVTCLLTNPNCLA